MSYVQRVMDAESVFIREVDVMGSFIDDLSFYISDMKRQIQKIYNKIDNYDGGDSLAGINFDSEISKIQEQAQDLGYDASILKNGMGPILSAAKCLERMTDETEI